MEGMTRGQLAKQTGVSMAAIRFYEDEGILPAPARSEGGYRLYSDDYLVMLKFIKDAQSLGYSLNRIGDILQLLGRGTGIETLKEAVRTQIEEIDAEIRRLDELKTSLIFLLSKEDAAIVSYVESFRGKGK